MAVFLASTWSLFKPGLFRVHDYLHAARILEMERAVVDGHIPPIWSENFGFGYGMPLFEFYAPFPFYVGAFLHWLGLSTELSVKALFVIPSFVSILGAYWLGKELWGKSAGVAVATVATLAPYRAVNLFVRGAVSEVWGMMMMPWVLLGGWWLIRKHVHGWWVLTLSLVVLLLSHNLTALMFVPLSFGLLTVWWLQQWRFDTKEKSWWLLPVKLTACYILAVGMSSYYIWPALLEKQHTQIESILSGYFHFGQHFLYIRQFFIPTWGYGGSGWGPDDGISFFLGYGQFFGFALGLVALVIIVKQLVTNKKNQLELIWRLFTPLSLLAATFGSLFLTLQHSEFFWQSFSPLSFIQFPWRWLGIATFAGALFTGYGVALLRHKGKWAVLVLILLTIWGNTPYFKPESYLDNNDLYDTRPEKIREQVSLILPDFVPTQVPLSITPAQTVIQNQEDWDDQLTVEINQTHQKLITVSSQTDRVLVWSVASFPGWQAEIDGEPVDHEVNELGLILVQLPAGTHTVGVYFGETVVRRTSTVITLVSGLIFLYLCLRTPLTKSTTKTL